MDHLENLYFDPSHREAMWAQVEEIIETYYQDIDGLSISPPLDPKPLRASLAPLDFTDPLDFTSALAFVGRGLREHQVHTAHPRYFGLFNPTPATMGIAADALVAAFNPQMAAWGHNPFAVEVEQHLVRLLGEKFGYNPAEVAGTFTSGGAEANHTALLAALTRHFPAYTQAGLRILDRWPVMYVSKESHHSFIKAARASGIGTDAVRVIPVDQDLKMLIPALEDAIAADREAGLAPFLVVGTAGTTSAGVIDPLPEIHRIAKQEGLWFHVDAAWGGAAALVPELRPLLAGIEQGDSLTFDAHKWLSVPMAAGLFLTRHLDILHKTFRISTAYIPTDGAGLDISDPYTHSIQWSRRFTGLKVFLSLAVAGWGGYESAIRHQTRMGNLLREKLQSKGWEVVNDTALPVVCFVDRLTHTGRTAAFISQVAREIAYGGQAWISETRLNETLPALRACITSFRTTPEDLDTLISALAAARQALAARL
jgi:glutamate/tyrosine decarboxylase-like PLP-dependent enzyme